MDFHYGTSFGKVTPEAYERLLLDAMGGDATLFARRDEVEEAWTFVDAIRAEWDRNSEDLALYAAGVRAPVGMCQPGRFAERIGRRVSRLVNGRSGGPRLSGRGPRAPRRARGRR